MTQGDKNALARLIGVKRQGGTSGVADLQGLLLQISLAIMMIFIIAFFVFRVNSEKQSAEQLMEITRQKLVLAEEQVKAEYREKYGLNVLMPLGEPIAMSELVKGDRLVESPLVKRSLCAGGGAASKDYSDVTALQSDWKAKVLESAQIKADELSEEDGKWLDESIGGEVRRLSNEVRKIQRLCAVEIQRGWIRDRNVKDEPEIEAIKKRLEVANDAERLSLATELSTVLKTRSLVRLQKILGTELMP